MCGGGIQSRRRGGVVFVKRDKTERRDVWHQNVAGAGARELLHQRFHVRSRLRNVAGTVVIEKIVAPAPDNIERGRVGRVTGEIIVDLFPEVIHGEGEVAAAERKRI